MMSDIFLNKFLFSSHEENYNFFSLDSPIKIPSCFLFFPLSDGFSRGGH